MSSSQFGKNDAAFFADLFRDYRNRMEKVAPFEAGIEREGIYVPGREEVEFELSHDKTIDDYDHPELII